MSMARLESTPRLGLSEVMQRATEGLSVLKRKVSGVTAVSKADNGWRVMVELVERTAVPDTMDLLGLYEVLLDAEGEVVSYERTRVRRRCDLEERVE